MKLSIILMLGIIAFTGGLAVVDAQKLRLGDGPQTGQAQTVIAKLNASRGIEVFADNSPGGGLHIQEATVKEIGPTDFRLLTGERAGGSIHVTYPSVTLANTSGKTITGFAIAVQNIHEPKVWHWVLPKNLSIAPNATHHMEANEWMIPEKVSVQVDGRFASRVRQPGVESTKAWLRARPESIRVVIAAIDFEDGSKWQIPSDYQ